MSKNHKNVDLSGGNFPENLRSLRESAHLTQTDLAEKAGITYRTVHDLEEGKRARAQEKTVMLLAKALDVSLEDLLAAKVADEDSPTTSRPSQRTWLYMTGLVLAAVAVAAGVLWHQGRARAEWTLDKGALEVRDGIFGVKLWEIMVDTPVMFCINSPWSPNHLIIGSGRQDPTGGKLLCLKRASGDTIWTMEPDIDAIVRAFGEEDVMAAHFTCRLVGVADLEGDDVPEVVVDFSHGKYYPTAICTVGPEGSRLSQYSHKGHVFDMAIEDLDADGKDEVIIAGVNNNKAHQGATVFILDDKHRNGASTDQYCNPASDEPDSALVRVVLPAYPDPYMDVFKLIRLGAFNMQIYRNKNDDSMMTIEVGGHDPNQRIFVHLDSELHPVGAEPKDYLVEQTISQWPDSLKNGTGPGDPVWLANWLAGHRRFEAGHWPPDLTLAK